MLRTLSIAGMLLLLGCATIMQGTTQNVGISSSPSGAQVSINGRQFGKTPVIANLSRKDNHIVRIELEGYESFEATLTRQTSGWVWGNILFGGIPGLIVDAISGGLYKLTPEQISASLNASGAAYKLEEDTLYIGVVFGADSTWQRVGSLVPR
jgi:hypothetical protein